jgi:hypothetical protein
MAENLRLARLFFLLLAIVTAGRWYLSFRVPYEVGTDKLSIVILTIFASLFYTAFCRRWRGFSLLQAVSLAALLAVSAQLVILLSTVVSYLAGLDTYFNNPKALNVTSAIPLGEALGRRAGGLVGNTIINSIVGMLGWAMGALLPADRK